ncbi:CidA/LrgA family protein [Candidatus Chloroploca sp. M-50]|uniref:CidA/LrgA family protein n=1 Tax=Candidatus Chloroploca mongolica TaxID=2528176 RepID=A0ABS4DBT1_9CHLR|nr:CidA/LrgA family protein [Candidatus Chloroploca mongolica]MBP1466897.1 CidA/LrgA family protein [Candidatus Chloroploca mongolica]
MINALLSLLVFQLLGEVLVRAMGVPIPGPVVGMLLLFGALKLRGRVPDTLHKVSEALLNNLSLLFVPAGVGVMVHLNLLRTGWWQLLVTVIVSTLITLVVTALTMQGLVSVQRCARGGQTDG